MDDEMKRIFESAAEPSPADVTFGDLSSENPVASPGRIMRLWDMLKLDTRSFLSSMTYLASTVADFRNLIRVSSGGIIASLDINGRAQIIQAIRRVRETCEVHGLKISASHAKSCEERCGDLLGQALHAPLGDNVLIGVSGAIEGLISSVIHEAESREFYAMAPDAGAYQASADDLFGEAVVDAFPAAAFDIEEAGKALSFGLWTACVMHLMRATEHSLVALAHHVGVTHRDSWGKTLNEIEVALRTVRKTEVGAEAEAWAAEAGTHLRFVKNAWRNRAMHPLETYDEARARMIYANVREFMRHVATRLGEPND